MSRIRIFLETFRERRRLHAGGTGCLPMGGECRRGFSLVEVLVAVALIGVVVFLALPNIVQIKEDSETHLAIARAEALNMGMASFIQAQGSGAAASAWSGASDDEARYTLVKPYLAFAPDTLALYTPGGYSLAFPASVLPLTKTSLSKDGTAVDY